MIKPLPSKAENPDGLHGRYIISKADGSPVDARAEYFVLRLDEFGEPHHVNACRIAVMAFAREIERTLPKLAADLRERYNRLVETRQPS